jgi:hypothetical protein
VPGETNDEFIAEGTNLDGDGNHLILDAEGRGHYLGCVLNVHSLRDSAEFDWYGEGVPGPVLRRSVPRHDPAGSPARSG